MTDTHAHVPHNLDAEQAVLGGLMGATSVERRSLLLADVQAVLAGVADFYRPAHQMIYAVIVDLAQAGEPADAIAVGAELTKRGEITRVGGAPYLHTIVEAVPVAVQAGYYAKIVADLAVLRRLVEAGTRIAQIGHSGTGDVDELVDRARAALLEATATASAHDGALEHITDDLHIIFDEIEGGTSRTKIPTGFADLDDLTGGGFERGQLIVVGARPALGKSTLALDFARAASRSGHHHAAFFGLEMSNKELRYRWLSAEARVPLHALRAGGDAVTEADWERLREVRARGGERHLRVADRCTTVAQIRAECRRYQVRQGRLDVVVVDYVQLIPSNASAETRQVAVAEASRQLKLLAKELDVVVIALSQLNRGPEQRVERRPVLSDLRESGAIEQDADVVILLHREDVYEKESPRAGEADLIVAKHRNGPTATVTVAFQGHYSRFVDMARG